MKQTKNELASVIEILKSDILLPTCQDLRRCYVVLIPIRLGQVVGYQMSLFEWLGNPHGSQFMLSGETARHKSMTPL